MLEDDSLKRCPKCGEFKPRDAFAKDRSKKDGRHSHCKACVNSKDMSEYMRNYDRVNAEKIRARKQRYYIENRDHIRRVHRDYYVANAETTIKRQRAYYWNNTHKLLPHYRAYYRTHRDVRRAANQRRRKKVKENGGTFTRKELEEMRREQAGICAYCKRQYDPDVLTMDHIIPLNQGGRHEKENICLACRRCNTSKNNRTPEQWTNRWYWREGL